MLSPIFDGWIMLNPYVPMFVAWNPLWKGEICNVWQLQFSPPPRSQSTLVTMPSYNDWSKAVKLFDLGTQWEPNGNHVDFSTCLFEYESK